jgi:hypothetical protein
MVGPAHSFLAAVENPAGVPLEGAVHIYAGLYGPVGVNGLFDKIGGGHHVIFGYESP